LISPSDSAPLGTQTTNGRNGFRVLGSACNYNPGPSPIWLFIDSNNKKTAETTVSPNYKDRLGSKVPAGVDTCRIG
jgi:hypothetical protein